MNGITEMLTASFPIYNFLPQECLPVGYTHRRWHIYMPQAAGEVREIQSMKMLLAQRLI
jgi:hypothetical protein